MSLLDWAAEIYSDIFIEPFANSTEQFMAAHGIEKYEFLEDYLEVEIDADTQDFNSVAHAFTSFSLAFDYGVPVSAFLGGVKEMLSDAHEMTDSLRDQYNNEVGLMIAAYALENEMSKDDSASLLASAISEGCLSFHDPDYRVFDSDFSSSISECLIEIMRGLGRDEIKDGAGFDSVEAMSVDDWNSLDDASPDGFGEPSVDSDGSFPSGGSSDHSFDHSHDHENHDEDYHSDDSSSDHGP